MAGCVGRFLSGCSSLTDHLPRRSRHRLLLTRRRRRRRRRRRWESGEREGRRRRRRGRRGRGFGSRSRVVSIQNGRETVRERRLQITREENWICLLHLTVSVQKTSVENSYNFWALKNSSTTWYEMYRSYLWPHSDSKNFSFQPSALRGFLSTRRPPELLPWRPRASWSCHSRQALPKKELLRATGCNLKECREITQSGWMCTSVGIRNQRRKLTESRHLLWESVSTEGSSWMRDCFWTEERAANELSPNITCSQPDRQTDRRREKERNTDK